MPLPKGLARLTAAGVCLVLAGSAQPVRSAEEVDVVLVLALDVSRSMSPSELEIQQQGYAEAIQHPEVIHAIAQGAHGRIAVAMFAWAADFSQHDIVGWTPIETAEDAAGVAEKVRAYSPVGRSRTSISGAIRRGAELIDAAPYEALRKVIDISGDGPNNQGEPVLGARQKALDEQIVINGLPLMTRGGPGLGFHVEELDAYYADCVIGGPGSFLVPVTNWAQFPEAVRRKLIQEIGGRPTDDLPVMKAQAQGESVDCLIGERIWEQRQWMFEDR